jgi:hypothetical protein
VGRSARIWGLRYPELLADRACETWADLLVSRECRDLALRSTPLGVLCTADLVGAVFAEVAFEIASLHAAATKRRCSRSPRERIPANSSSGVSTVRRASSTLSRASWRVRPWLSAPGTSSTRATIQPASSGSSNEIVKSISEAIATG